MSGLFKLFRHFPDINGGKLVCISIYIYPIHKFNNTILYFNVVPSSSKLCCNRIEQQLPNTLVNQVINQLSYPGSPAMEDMAPCCGSPVDSKGARIEVSNMPQ